MERYFIDDSGGRYSLHDRTLGHDTLLGGFPQNQAELAQRICVLLNADEAVRATGTHQSQLAERAAKGQTNL